MNVTTPGNIMEHATSVRDGVHALILDDSQFDRSKIRRMLRTGGLPFQLDEAEALEHLSAILADEEFDIIIIDYNLPQGNGLEALDIIQKSAKNSKTPTIMITGDDQSQIAVDAMKSGCLDYITKSQLSAQRLKTSILAAVKEAGITKSDEDSRQKNIEFLTNKIMTQYSNAVQPKMAKVVRDIRALKATMANPKSNLPADLEEIEKKCIGIWAILAEPKELGLRK